MSPDFYPFLPVPNTGMFISIMSFPHPSNGLSLLEANEDQIWLLNAADMHSLQDIQTCLPWCFPSSIPLCAKNKQTNTKKAMLRTLSKIALGYSLQRNGHYFRQRQAPNAGFVPCWSGLKIKTTTNSTSKAERWNTQNHVNHGSHKKLQLPEFEKEKTPEMSPK